MLVMFSGWVHGWLRWDDPGPRIVPRDRDLCECFSNHFRSSSADTIDLNNRSVALPNAFDAAAAHYMRNLHLACLGWHRADLVEIALDIRVAPRPKEAFLPCPFGNGDPYWNVDRPHHDAPLDIEISNFHQQVIVIIKTRLV